MPPKRTPESPAESMMAKKPKPATEPLADEKGVSQTTPKSAEVGVAAKDKRFEGGFSHYCELHTMTSSFVANFCTRLNVPADQLAMCAGPIPFPIKEIDPGTFYYDGQLQRYVDPRFKKTAAEPTLVDFTTSHYVSSGLYTTKHEQKFVPVTATVPHGRGELWTRHLSVVSTFTNGMANGLTKITHFGGEQHVGQMVHGVRHGRFKMFNATTGAPVGTGMYALGLKDGEFTTMVEGVDKGVVTYKDGKRHGAATEHFVSTKETHEGAYVDDKRHGTWTITSGRGDWYTQDYYNNGVLDESSKSASTWPDGLEPSPTELRASPTTDDASSPQSSVPHTQKPPRNQHEASFRNEVVEKWRKEHPKATITTEVPVKGRSVDVTIKMDDMIGIGEFKWRPDDLAHAAGQAVVKYRGPLVKTNPAYEVAKDAGKLVTFVALPTAPNADDAENALEECNVHTWWKGQPFPLDVLKKSAEFERVGSIVSFFHK